MSDDSGTDFPLSRKLITRLPAWIDEMANLLPAPKKVHVDGGFQWEWPIHNADVVQVNKAVRMASGIAAALQLADLGFTTECAVLLRTVSDFGAEILFLAEGLLEGRMIAAQEKFIEDHFKPLPKSPEELAAREREYYVGRRDILKAHERIAEKARGSGAKITGVDMTMIAAYLSKGYDSYVHGASITTMELYSGKTHRFMMTGHESAKHRCIAKTSVAGKLHEVIAALEFMAITRKLPTLTATIDAARCELTSSNEQSGAPCDGLV